VDVAVLGDSLVAGPGIGLEGEFTTLLGRRLNGLRVLNLGLPGGGTEHDYLVYRKYVEPLNPRLLIAVVCPAWDIDNSLHFERWRAEGSPGDFTKFRWTYGETHLGSWDLVKRQLGRSHLVLAAHRGVRSFFDADRLLEQVEFPNGAAIFLSARLQRRLAQGMHRASAPNLRETFFRPLEQLQSAVVKHGGRFLVALLPSKEEVYGAAAFPAVLRSVQEVRRELESRGLPLLDLYPVFEELGQQAPPFYRADIHLNELGSQIVAAALAKWVTDEKIFTAPAASITATGPAG
jgi:lysophospholipase L1-like esterase